MNENNNKACISITDDMLITIIDKLCSDAHSDPDNIMRAGQIATCNLYMASLRLLLTRRLRYTNDNWLVIDDNVYGKMFGMDKDDLCVSLFFNPVKCELFILYTDIPLYHIGVDINCKIDIMAINMDRKIPDNDEIANYTQRCVFRAMHQIDVSSEIYGIDDEGGK